MSFVNEMSKLESDKDSLTKQLLKPTSTESSKKSLVDGLFEKNDVPRKTANFNLKP